MKIRNSIALALTTAVGLNAGVNLMTPDGNATAKLKYDLPAFTVDTVTVEGISYSRVNANNFDAITLEKGAPELPYSGTALQLLGSGNVSVKIESVKYREIDVLPVLPSKGMLTRNIDPATVPLVEGESYSDDKWFPENSVQLEKPYNIRDVRGVAARIYPFSYNSATGKLRIAEQIVFSVIEENKIAARSGNSVKSDEFKTVLENRFINAEEPLMLRYTTVPDGDKMAIITANEYRDASDKLAQWKNRKGIATTVYNYPSETGSGASTLKSFIQGLYDQEGITYVTLVGDWEDIPSKLMNYADGSGGSADDNDVSSDPTYTYLSGNDLYPDIFIGRLSVESASQAETVVNKILTYEMSPEVGADWYEKAVAIGSNEGTPTDYQWLSDSINPVLLNSHYKSVDEIYQGFGESNSKFSSQLNEGRGYVNFMGHGNNDSFLFGGGSPFRYRSRDVNALRNGDRLPVVVPLACQFGTFKGRTVVSEAWLRQPNGGAIVIMGSTPLMDWTPGQYAEVEMGKLISRHAHSSMGAYFYNSEMKMLDVSRGDKTMNTWTYFGDPSLQFITSTPTQLELNVAGEVSVGTNTLTVSGESGALVTIYSAELGIQKSKLISGGSVDFTFDANDVGKLYVTGTKRNTAPYLDSIDVSDVAEENVAPTDILISNDTIMAGSPIGTLIGVLSAVDANIRDQHQYTLDCTCESFGINKDSITVTGPLEVGDIPMAITVVDQGGLSITKELTITVIPNRFVDMLSQAGWSAGADTKGSSSEMSIDSVESVKTCVTIDLMRASNPAYDKWANLSGSFAGDLVDVNELRISYTATDSIKLVFPMDEYLTSGEGHYLALPATAGAVSTVTFTVDDLIQPSWVAANDLARIRPEDVHTVLVELACQDTAKTSGTVELFSLGMDGYRIPVANTMKTFNNIPSGITVQTLNADVMNIGVPAAGAYKVELYALNGRRLFSKDVNLQAGFSQVALNNTSAKGLVLLRIQGNKQNLVRKAILK